MLRVTICSLSTLAAYGAVSGKLGLIRASNEPGDFNFYDEHGRVRIFHGCNRARKAPPWYTTEMYDSDDVAIHMQRLGFTVVRLGFMWSGYNPAPGVFNQTYVDVIKAIVDRLAQRGVYSLLNVQMDGLSSKFETYDGAPLWVVNKSIPKHAFPWPLLGARRDHRGAHKESNIMSEASATAYQDIFDNNHGMLDDFVAFWSHAAGQFKDVPSIIGYDIINEPFAGNFYEDPALLLPGVAGKKNLQRMYDIVAAAIRQHDHRHILFYEPVTWGMVFDGAGLGSGFEHVPGGEQYRNRSAYSYHYYCASFLPSYNYHPMLQRLVCDKTLARLVWRSVTGNVKRLGGAAMMTEGMQCRGDGAYKLRSGDGVQSECQVNMKQLDDNLFSWVDWNFDINNGISNEAWARTYARAVAGRPLSMSFDPETKDFSFCFQMDPALDAPTEIFASTAFSYPDGLVVNSSENVKAVVDGDLVIVTPASSGANSSKACVHISRRPPRAGRISSLSHHRLRPFGAD
jgi:endoglycosylceramidase